MTDLLHKLRTKDFNAKETCVEAADRIERLDQFTYDANLLLKAQKAEIERLTKALALQTTLADKQSTTIARLTAKAV